jgi:hypothetical protein
MLWVTFPYNESLGEGQPEIMARVVRLTNGLEGTQQKQNSSRELQESALAVRFELTLPSTPNGDGQASERRATERRPIALPVRVRWRKVPWFEEAMTVDVSAEGLRFLRVRVRWRKVPWFEEAMTVDVSAEGLRFLSNREYPCGDELLVSFDPAVSAPWPSATEHRAKVVRVEPLPESPALAVTVRRLV